MGRLPALGPALVAGALALAACSPAATPAPQPTIASSGGLAFPRTLQADRYVEVQLMVTGEVDALVTSASLASPFFESADAVATNVRVSPGWAGRVRVPLGAATCPAGSGPVVATVTYAAARGEAETTTEVALPSEVLAGINATECERRETTDAAQPAFGEVTGRPAGALEATLVFSRGTNAVGASVVQVGGNIIFEIRAAEGAVPVAVPAAGSVTVPVVITAARCDPHAFAESKKTFVFPAWIELDGERRYVEFGPDAAWRAELQALFDACGEEQRAG